MKNKEKRKQNKTKKKADEIKNISDLNEFKIDTELDGLFFDLKDIQPFKYEQLKADIKKMGIDRKLRVLKDGIIVCGMQRYKIAKELGIPDKKIPYEIVEFKTRQEMIEEAIKDNQRNRSLNNYHNGLAGLKLLPFYENEAEKRQKAGTSLNKFNEGGLALKLAAEQVGLSHMTLYMVRYIETEATSEQKDQLMKGTAKVTSVYNDIRNKETKKRIEQELIDDEKRRLQHHGKRFSNDVESFLTTELNKYLIRTPTPDEQKAVAKDKMTLSYDWFTITTKTEEGKRVLSRFTHPDSKIKKMEGGEMYVLSHLGFAIKILNKIDSSATIKLKKNKPLTIENEHFKITIRGTV